MTRPVAAAGILRVPHPGDPLVDPSTVDANHRALIPRYGAESWLMTFATTNPSIGTAHIHWSAFPPGLRGASRGVV